MNNHMAEVAKLLGVELGESFKIVDNNSGKYHNYYRLTEEKGIEVSDDNANWEMAIAGVLKWLLMGDARIIKLPWKPSHGDKYWTPTVNNVEMSAFESRWSNSDNDYYRYEHGFICRTKEEADELTEKLLAMVKEAREDG